jgi:UDP-N-acetylmuramoylalanine--D-glutamate ligase
MSVAPKSAVVLGLGRSGRAAALLLAGEGVRVTVCESADTPATRRAAEEVASAGVRVLLGRGADADPASYDVCVLSPGIAASAPLARNVLDKGIPVIGELELAFARCRCPVAAITGTNGKTTTTGLVAAMLGGTGLRTIAAGNIGLPFSEAVKESARLDVMVLEASSFQLETIRTFRPRVAAWLNFSPNHLDRHASVAEYRAAKLRIFENQTSGDFAVLNARDDPPSPASKHITFSSAPGARADLTLRGTEILHAGRAIFDQAGTRLPGVHNAENLMAAFGIGVALGADCGAMARVARDLAPPGHRCEFVRELDGIRYVNDSKATNLDALGKALLAVSGPVVLIAGGKDKGFGFGPLHGLVREKVREAVLIGEMRGHIAGAWPDVPCHCAGSLEEAVTTARRAARPGDTVLLSPGTSSFDMFTDYTERGRLFKEAVRALEPLKPQPTTTP